MDRAERAALREALRPWKDRQHVEVLVYKLRELLDECDRLDAYDPLAHDVIAMEHYRGSMIVDGCKCTTCESRRAYSRLHERGTNAVFPRPITLKDDEP